MIHCLQRKSIGSKNYLVNRRKRFVIYALVSMFGFLFLKNLSADIVLQDSDNCDEIAHIHLHKNFQTSVTKKISEKNSAEECCHSGKSIFTSAVYLEPALIGSEFLGPWFSVVSNLLNHFQSPFLEGPRKPPRAYLNFFCVS